MLMKPSSVLLIEDFDDPRLNRETWNSILQRGQNRNVFLTWEWQRSWWRAFGRGRLMLLLATKEGEVPMLVPLFGDGGMAFFVGSGGSDYLDMLGGAADASLMAAVLERAAALIRGFIGYRFYHVSESSKTHRVLVEAADLLGLPWFDEGSLTAPALDMRNEVARESALRKKSLIRHEKYFRKEDKLRVDHYTDSASIVPLLDDFFDQHIARWSATPYPSLFLEENQRRFYRYVVESATDTGWLRFTRLLWEGQAIAYHFGFHFEGTYLWYKPTFDIRLSKHSPGEVLLLQLLQRAIQEGAATFDFGLGEEGFKSRFATHTQTVNTIGIYAKSTKESA